eukprot:scaffold1088_cov177-Ochromonas_danica.AAC.3
MPITPKFKLSQDDIYVTITIHVPYIRITNAELEVDGCDFSFFCNPYLLKLTFPGEFADEVVGDSDGDGDVDREEVVGNETTEGLSPHTTTTVTSSVPAVSSGNEVPPIPATTTTAATAASASSASYDLEKDHGTLTVKLRKKNQGEVFVNLDLLSTLFRVKPIDDLVQRKNASIEVIHSENYVDNEDTKHEEGEEQWVRAHDDGYGFLSLYHDVFPATSSSSTSAEIFELPQLCPDRLPAITRRYLRIQTESARFDWRRYLGDETEGEEDPLYTPFLTTTPCFIDYHRVKKELSQKKKVKGEQEEEEEEELQEETVWSACGHSFSSEETDYLVQVSRRPTAYPWKLSLLSKVSIRGLGMQLADLLFALCYDYRLTQGERGVESPANIVALSPALAWLDVYNRSSSLHSENKRDRGEEREKDSRGEEEKLPAENDDEQEEEDSFLGVIAYSMRRLVTYAYLRSWTLGLKVIDDVLLALQAGRRCLLLLLVRLALTFEHSHGQGAFYLFNHIYLKDWIAFFSKDDSDRGGAAGGGVEEIIKQWASEYAEARKTFIRSPHNGKDLVGLHLHEIESHVDAMLEEEEEDYDDDDSIPETLKDNALEGFEGKKLMMHLWGPKVRYDRMIEQEEKEKAQQEEELKERSLEVVKEKLLVAPPPPPAAAATVPLVTPLSPPVVEEEKEKKKESSSQGLFMREVKTVRYKKSAEVDQSDASKERVETVSEKKVLVEEVVEGEEKKPRGQHEDQKEVRGEEEQTQSTAAAGQLVQDLDNLSLDTTVPVTLVPSGSNDIDSNNVDGTSTNL